MTTQPLWSSLCKASAILTSEVLTIVVSRVDNIRFRYRLQNVNFMNRILVYFGAREPEVEQVQAPSNDVVPLVFDVLSLSDGKGMCRRFMMAFLLVFKHDCSI